MSDLFELYAAYDGYPPGAELEWAFDNLPREVVIRMLAQEMAVDVVRLADESVDLTGAGFDEVFVPLVNQFAAQLEQEFPSESNAVQQIAARSQWYEGLYFRSTSEVCIARALDSASRSTPLVYFPNARGRFGPVDDRVNREPDFLVMGEDLATGVLEVDGPHHDVSADAQRDALFASHGIPVRRYPASECFNDADGVVADFLGWLRAGAA